MNAGILYPRSTGVDLDLGLTNPLLGVPQVIPVPHHMPKNYDWLLGNSDGSSSEDYVIEIDTTLGRSTTVGLSIIGGNLGFMTIDWGDGTSGGVLPAGTVRRAGSYETRLEFTGTYNVTINHTYARHGIYRITVRGTFSSGVIGGNPVRIPANLTAVLSYGKGGWNQITTTSSSGLVYVPPRIPSSVSLLNNGFNFCVLLNHPNLGYWDTSRITSMTSTFNGCSNLVGIGLENWNTQSCTNFANTFLNCTSLGRGIVLDLSNWNVTGVTTMQSMFQGCVSLSDTIISGWYGASGCNHTSQFNSANLTRAYLPDWKFIGSNVCNSMFASCNLADVSGIDTWQTSGITDCTNMFRLATSLSIDFSNWNVSRVTTMNGMFSQNNTFTGSGIQNWNLAGLNSSSSLTNFANTATIPSGQYDLILNSWAANTGAAVNGVANWRTDLTPHFGTSKYTAAGSGSRAALVAYGWTITDGGLQT